MQEFDLIVIGSGPAGYTGSIRAAQLGMKVACIEKHQTLGGTCLNVGCIPSKALLNFSEKYLNARENFADIGIRADVSLDLPQMMQKKDIIVNDLCRGISGLFAKNKITRIIGHAKIIAKGGDYTVEIQPSEKNSRSEQIRAKNILIATGSEVINISGIEIDEKLIVSSTGALSLPSVPKEMVVIGGGYIGLELGSVWHRLGARVKVIEYADTIVPGLDEEIRNHFAKILTRQGMQFLLNTKVIKAEVVKAEKKEAGVLLTISDVHTNQETNLAADIVLVAVGRKPNTRGLGLDEIGIKCDSFGRIEVNDHFQTNINNIYAVGDVIKGAMLAHKAEEEAIAAVEIMNQQAGHVNYQLIPGVIYTNPEVASVGATEQELKAENRPYKVGKFPFSANSRARANNHTDGLVKLLADKETDRLLGAHIIAPDAGTLIAEIVAYMEFGAAAEDIARTCHAHPTLNEAIKEAALAVAGRTINI